MRVATPGGLVHLGYCTNIHSGHSWAEISDNLDTHVPAIKAAVSPDEPFGIGLRLSAEAAAELAAPNAVERFKAQLASLGAYVFTINAFPYGRFHDEAVKARAYEPDWRTAERVRFTTQAAAVLARLLPDGGYGSLSTVPGAYRTVAHSADAIALIADNLLRSAAELVTIERRTGRALALALEPEPCCLIETVAESIAFFEAHLLATPAVARFAALTALDAPAAEAALRRHLGVCYDVCHGAVEFEDPAGALRALRGAGIAVPKIQLSAALRVPAMTEAYLDRLAAFDDGVYLHQVVVQNGGLHRFEDLPAAIAAYRAGRASGEWRIHCHVPIFLADPGALGSTQGHLLTVLAALREERFAPHLEVETYTWDVLPAELRSPSPAEDIARELDFVLKELRR